MKNFISLLKDFFFKKCPVCQGSGITECICNDDYEITCPNCLGNGMIKKTVITKNYAEVPCDNPNCNNGRETCVFCKGKGYVGEHSSCPVCHGSGYVECKICHGTNKIIREYTEEWQKNEVCPTCSGKKYIACPYCHGTKKRSCPKCNGKGSIICKENIFIVTLLICLCIIMPVFSITVIGFITVGLTLYLLTQIFLNESKDK